MATPEQIEEFRTASAALTAKVEADLAKFWATIDITRAETTISALLNYVPLLTKRYGDIASTIAADWYELLRADAVEEGLLASLKGAKTYKALAADPLAKELSAKSLAAVKSASGYLWTPTPERALGAIQRTTSRAVLQVGRDTITQNAGRDRGARGWSRATRSGACKFCKLAASDDGVFTEASSHFAAHDDCHCVSYPEFNPRAPKVDVAAEFVASVKSEAMSAVERERFRAKIRDYMAKMPDGPGDVIAG